MAKKKNNRNAQSTGNQNQYQFGGMFPAPQGSAPGADMPRKKLTKKELKERERKRQLAQMRKQKFLAMKARQDRAKENLRMRGEVESSFVEKGGNSRYKLPVDKKSRRKGKDYFFVMRKSVCFLIMLLFILMIGLLAVDYLKLVPQYTALMVEPDYTPDEERLSVEDEEGNVIEYVDKSVYYSATDPLFGFLAKYVGFDMGVDTPLYDYMVTMTEVGMQDTIATYVMLFFPVLIVLIVIFALIGVIKALLAMGGRRIYKRFGLIAIFTLIFAVLIGLAGVAVNTAANETMNYANLVAVLTSALIKPAAGVAAPTYAAGIGLLAYIALSAVILILSLFAKRRVPYSIFD